MIDFEAFSDEYVSIKEAGVRDKLKDMAIYARNARSSLAHKWQNRTPLSSYGKMKKQIQKDKAEAAMNKMVADVFRRNIDSAKVVKIF